MIPSPTEILYFVEIYNIRHVSKAAMRLGVSQPTLTQSLKRLEHKVGSPLFFRTKQGVVPTPAAALFYSRAKSLQESWAELQSGVHSAQNEIEGSFRVGCHPSVGSYTLPPFFRQLSQEAPRIQIVLQHDSSRKITEGLVSYDIDLGFVVNPPRHPDLVLRKLGNDRVTFWKKRGAHDLPPVIFADGTRAQVEELLGRTLKKHFAGWKIVSSSNLELIRTLTRLGLGVGVLPERVASVDSADLMIYDKHLPSRPDEIFLAYRKEVLASKAGRELIRLAEVKL